MQKFILKDGILTLKLKPDYIIDNKLCYSLSRTIKKEKKEINLSTISSIDKSIWITNYKETIEHNDNIFNLLYNKGELSYNYSYNLPSSNGNDLIVNGNYSKTKQEVTITNKKHIQSFTKELLENGDISYIYRDNNNSYLPFELIISYDSKEKETIYSFNSSQYMFRFSEIIDNNNISESFSDDTEIGLISDNGIVYQETVEIEEEELDELDNFLDNASIEEIENSLFDNELSTNYEEIDFDEKYYLNNGHGPIYNAKIDKYIYLIELHLGLSIQAFPFSSKDIISHDKDYIEKNQKNFSNFDLTDLTINNNGDYLIENTINNIYTKKKQN